MKSKNFFTLIILLIKQSIKQNIFLFHIYNFILKSVKETPVVRNEEATSSCLLTSHPRGLQAQNHVVQRSKITHAGFPPYGLPQGYTPPIGEYPEQEHVTITVPVNISDPNATCLKYRQDDCFYWTLNDCSAKSSASTSGRRVPSKGYNSDCGSGGIS